MAEDNVLPYTSVHHPSGLCDISNAAADNDFTFSLPEIAEKCLEKRRLSGANASNDAAELSLATTEVDVLQHQLVFVPVPRERRIANSDRLVANVSD
jgi:hypothetical protein